MIISLRINTFFKDTSVSCLDGATSQKCSCASHSTCPHHEGCEWATRGHTIWSATILTSSTLSLDPAVMYIHSWFVTPKWFLTFVVATALATSYVWGATVCSWPLPLFGRWLFTKAWNTLAAKEGCVLSLLMPEICSMFAYRWMLWWTALHFLSTDSTNKKGVNWHSLE